MKIIKVWPFWPKGLMYHDQYLSLEMENDGVQTTFCCPFISDDLYTGFTNDINDEESKYNFHKFKFFTICNKPIPYSFYSFVRFLNLYSPDVVHIFGLSNFTSIFTLICLYFSNYNGKVFFNDHSDSNERKTGFLASFYYFIFRILYHLFFPKSAVIVIPDEGTKNELIFRYGYSINEQLKFIPLGFNSEVFRLEKKYLGKKFKIGFAGKIFPAKRVNVLINVVNNLIKTNKLKPSDFDVDIIGFSEELSSYEISLLNYRDTNNLCNVNFKRFLSSPSQLAEFYNSCHLVVFPGSISITTFEANACGCPILLFNSVKGLEHRVNNGRGHLFTDDADLLKLVIHYYTQHIQDSILREDIAQASLKYSWHSIKEKYYEIYDFRF